MSEYHDYLPHHRNRKDHLPDRDDRVLLAILLVILFVGLGLAGREDMEAKSRKVPEWRPAINYERPAAWRKQTPTMDEMNHLEHMMKVSQVGR